MTYTDSPATDPANTQPATYLDLVHEQAQRQYHVNCDGELPIERLAHATRLPQTPTTLDDPAWLALPVIGDLLRRNSAGFAWAPGYKVRVAFDDVTLAVRFDIPGRCRAIGELQGNRVDHLEFALDTAHDHLHYAHFSLTPGGQLAARHGRRPYDSQRWERKYREKPIEADTITCDEHRNETRWSVLIRIPFAAIDAQPTGRWGFNCCHSSSDPLESPACWNVTYQQPLAPWGAGQLSFVEQPSVHLFGVDLDELRLSEQRCRLRLQGFRQGPVRGRVRLEVNNGPEGDQPFWSDEQSFDFQGPDTHTLDLPLHWNTREYHHDHWLIIHLQGDDGEQQRAVYRFGRGEGRVMQYAPPPPGDHPNPRPGDPDFIVRKRNYILARLPRMRRLTTAQGAASDYVLAAESDDPCFNLMVPDALQQMADYLYNLFDNDIDRLIGSTYFVNQPAVFTYANTPSGMVAEMSPLSLLRFGSGQCCCFAAAQIGIVERMRCDESGQTYRATRVSLPGHVLTAVQFRGKLVVVDPSYGQFFYDHNDRDLVSMEDLFADRTLAGRNGKYLEQFYADGSTSPTAPKYYSPGQTIWPHGAPAET